jgi:hypothetical protein
LALETFNLQNLFNLLLNLPQQLPSSDDEILSQDIEEAVVIKASKRHNLQNK